MVLRLFTRISLRSFLCGALALSSVYAFAQQNKPVQQSNTKADKNNTSGTIPTYSSIGFAKLTSNLVERGLTFSNSKPAFNASFLVNLGSQFSLGFWGSNIAKLDETSDNNLWVKYIAEAKVDFLSNANAIFFFQDDHFYPSDIRNGQRYGLRLKYSRFSWLLEAQSNFEATGSSAFYTLVDFTKKYSDKYGLMLSTGYTYQNSNYYRDYFDFSAVAFYQPVASIRGDLGVSLPSNTYQFGSRSTLHYFMGLSVSY